MLAKHFDNGLSMVALTLTNSGLSTVLTRVKMEPENGIVNTTDGVKTKTNKNGKWGRINETIIQL